MFRTEPKQLNQTTRTTSTFGLMNERAHAARVDSRPEWLMRRKKWRQKKEQEFRLCRKKERNTHTHTQFLRRTVWISKRVCFVNQFNCCLIINYCFQVFLIRCERFPNWRSTRKHNLNGIAFTHAAHDTLSRKKKIERFWREGQGISPWSSKCSKEALSAVMPSALSA